MAHEAKTPFGWIALRPTGWWLVKECFENATVVEAGEFQLFYGSLQ